MSPLVGTWMPGVFVSKVCYVIKLFPIPDPPDRFLLEMPAGYGLHRWVRSASLGTVCITGYGLYRVSRLSAARRPLPAAQSTAVDSCLMGQ